MPVTIKKYSNRRLYDPSESRYITQDELAQKIRSGVDVQVVDAKSGEDLTQGTLAQIVLESRGASKLLPVPLLVQMIRMDEGALTEFLGHTVSWALAMYQQARQQMQRMQQMNPFAQMYGGQQMPQMNPFAQMYGAPQMQQMNPWMGGGPVPRGGPVPQAGPMPPNPEQAGAYAGSAPPPPPPEPEEDAGPSEVELLRRELEALKESLKGDDNQGE